MEDTKKTLTKNIDLFKHESTAQVNIELSKIEHTYHDGKQNYWINVELDYYNQRVNTKLNFTFDDKEELQAFINKLQAFANKL